MGNGHDVLISVSGVSTFGRKRFGAKTMAILLAVMRFREEKEATSFKYLGRSERSEGEKEGERESSTVVVLHKDFKDMFVSLG
jgi:hypothetical protein